MTFHSILFDRPEQRAGADQLGAPPFFRDLNLDQVVESITATRPDYNLKPFFYTLPLGVETIHYRQDILRDLEAKDLWECVRSFARQMRSMREHLTQAGKLHYRYQKEAWFVDAVEIYGQAVTNLYLDLESVTVRSQGFLTFREYLKTHTQSREFTSLLAETAKLKQDLAGVKYILTVHDNHVTVSKYEAESDYAAKVLGTFQKFQLGVVKDYRVQFRDWAEMNHVEAAVLDRIALLYPEVFGALNDYSARHRDYLDQTIGDFDREVQFYVAYLEYVRLFKAGGLTFCYPHVSDSKDVHASETFDLALANKLVSEGSPVVCNEFYLQGPERIFVVTGPNQGGKTTFARTFGQLHYLASIGCQVPGREARLLLFDNLFTHFEREENLADLKGKLQDELIRIHHILSQATSNTVLIMNESFTSTTLSDALFLGKNVLERIMRLGLLCVSVTFVDELAALSESTVSMMSTVAFDDPTVRTYKVVRKPADGRAYAVAIAQKYGLTRQRLMEHIVR
ncbi:MAG: DNA mismatch repair protein MutS [Candidatus Dormibacteraeota bacterium]|nr:DNA mismatch repair protein MutS [Candidatus Dormibacteraeota bacterium]